MSDVEKKYTIDDVCFSKIRNRNEVRVIKEIRRLLDLDSTPPLACKDWQDVYALALNALTPRYAQSGTIVLRDPVRKDNVTQAVQEALAQVHHKPKI